MRFGGPRSDGKSAAEQAHALRQRDLKLREIADELRISTSYARVLLAKSDRRERALAKLGEIPDDIEALADAGRLSRKAAHAVQILRYRHLDSKIIRVADLAQISEWHLSVAPGLGRAGTAAIRGLAHSFGVTLAETPASTQIEKP